MKEKRTDIRTLTLTALMAALIFVLTRAVQIATPGKGYIHLGDSGITFTALAFGPWVGAIAGGLGTALADLTSGYPTWAPFSLVIHGLQGWAIGTLTRRSHSLPSLVAATVASLVIIAGGYFLAGLVLMGMGAALADIVPNLIQALSGAVIGIPLYFAVLKAYPPLGSRSEG